MSTARSADTEHAPAVAAALSEARFVRIVSRADGDSVAASGVLARTLRSLGVPFQVRVSPDPQIGPGDDELTVGIGATTGDISLVDATRPASALAFEVATEFDADPDPVLALAGIVAAESNPDPDENADVLSAAETRGQVDRRPGVAIPVANLGDGLAHSTLFRAPFSGDVTAAEATLAELDLPAELDVDAHRRLASLVAIDVVSVDDVTERGVERLERALRPYATPEGPFETVGGFADVLDAVAREQSGTGIALALGHDATAAALDAWRRHAARAHAALDSATTGRYDGVFVARVDADGDRDANADAIDGDATDSSSDGVPAFDGYDPSLATAARLLRDFRSPEPVALVVGEDGAAAASVEPRALGSVAVDAAAALDGDVGGYGTATRAEVRFDDATDTNTFITAFREALA